MKPVSNMKFSISEITGGNQELKINLISGDEISIQHRKVEKV